MERFRTTTGVRDCKWLDGTMVEDTYYNFAEEPGNGGGSETIGVFITEDGKWKSYIKSKMIHVVCQRSFGENFDIT